MRRRVFEISHAGIYRITHEHPSLEIGVRELSQFLVQQGFDLRRPIRTMQTERGTLFIQNEIACELEEIIGKKPEDYTMKFFLVSLVLKSAGLGEDHVERIYKRASEEKRDPLKVAYEEAELIRKLEG